MKQGGNHEPGPAGTNPDYQPPLLVVVENGVVLQQNVEECMPWRHWIPHLPKASAPTVTASAVTRLNHQQF